QRTDANRHADRPQERFAACPGRDQQQPANGRQGPDQLQRQERNDVEQYLQRVRRGEQAPGGYAMQCAPAQEQQQGQNATGNPDQGGQNGRGDGGADHFGQNRVPVRNRQRLPQQDAAIAAIVVQRTKAIKE